MPKLTDEQVLDAHLDDWRKLAQALHARFLTGDVTSGVAFVGAVSRVSHDIGGFPEVRLTTAWVELKLSTQEDGWCVTERDVELARRISAVAGECGAVPDPKAVAQVELGLDTADIAGQGPFWAALLTGSREGAVHDEVIDADFRVPNLWFQQTEPHPTPRQRFHVDLWLAHDAAEERIAAAVAAGGRVVDDSNAPSFVVLTDLEGNRACICTCLDR
ncbi:MAG TPA: VOC family protein [Acidimicrobiales bacterium]|nr:VOC family protein [Acidimicrobiales bacterium]